MAFRMHNHNTFYIGILAQGVDLNIHTKVKKWSLELNHLTPYRI